MIFEYIRNEKNKIHSLLSNHSTIKIIGCEKMGKTTLLESIQADMSSDDFFTLNLDGVNNKTKDYSDISHSLSIHKVDTRYTYDSAVDATGKSGILGISILDAFLKRKVNRMKYYHIGLNSTEIEIVNRIKVLAKGRKVILFIDNYDYIDSGTKNLLEYLIRNQNIDSENEKMFKDLFCVFTCIDQESIKFGDSNTAAILLKELTFQEFCHELDSLDFNISSSLFEDLFNLTNGNIGLLNSILTALEEDSLSMFNSIEDLNDLEKYFRSLVDERIDKIESSESGTFDTLKRAVIIGSNIKPQVLSIFADKTIEKISNIINYCVENRIVKVDTTIDVFNFSTTIIKNYLYSMKSEINRKYHDEYAKLLSELDKPDYYLSYYHYRTSGNDNAAMIMSIFYLLNSEYQLRKPDTELIKYIKNNELYYEFYKTIIEIKQMIHDKADLQLIVNKIDMLDYSYPIMMLLEIDYYKALSYYSLGSNNDYYKAEKILNEFNNSVEANDYTTYIKFNMLLLLLYINRLGEYGKAKKIEKNITRFIAKRSNIDNLKDQKVLTRISPALYNFTVAEEKLRKGVEYFSTHYSKYPTEFLRTSNNWAAIKICLSKYDEVDKILSGTIARIEQDELICEAEHKIINNYLINKIYQSYDNIQDVLRVYKNEIWTDSKLKKSGIVQNNYYVILFLNDKYNLAFESQLQLFSNNDRMQHNDYYTYLIGYNLTVMSILLSRWDVAIKVFKIIKNIIPSIMKNENRIIVKRFEVIENLLEHRKENLSINQIEELYENNLCVNKGSYESKCFLLSDLQFWSLF